MNILLSHGNIEWIALAIVYFICIASLYYKIKRGRFVACTIEIVVFVVLFKLHGGSVSGSTAAAVAALLTGTFLVPKF